MASVPLAMILWPTRPTFQCGTMIKVGHNDFVFVLIDTENDQCQLCEIPLPHVHPGMEHFHWDGTKWIANQPTTPPPFGNSRSWATRKTN